MPTGDNPNSRANLAKSYGGTGKFTAEASRKASKKAAAKRTAKKKLREEVNREIVERVFDEVSTEKILESIKTLALQGDADMIKLYVKMVGADKTGADQRKADADLAKTKKETKRIEQDTKRIEAETKLLELKIASPDEAADDGFFDAIEGRIPDVWDDDKDGESLE